MNTSEITRYITDTFPDVNAIAAWGETSFFYNPGRTLPRGVYFATLKEKDGANDRASNLQRPEVFRLNIGVGKATYRSLFGEPPSRPIAGGIVETGHDFSELDTLLPHPVYAWMSWVCIVSPTASTFEEIKPLLAEAYAVAVSKHARRRPAR